MLIVPKNLHCHVQRTPTPGLLGSLSLRCSRHHFRNVLNLAVSVYRSAPINHCSFLFSDAFSQKPTQSHPKGKKKESRETLKSILHTSVWEKEFFFSFPSVQNAYVAWWSTNPPESFQCSPGWKKRFHFFLLLPIQNNNRQHLLPRTKTIMMLRESWGERETERDGVNMANKM